MWVALCHPFFSRHTFLGIWAKIYTPMPLRLVFTYLLLLSCASLSAQSNYWTQQYGARATLTGGVCMSCRNDNSVFYYNPGAIGFIDSANINIASQIYGLDFINLKNAAGSGIDMTNNRLSINAQVMVGNLSFKKIPRLKLVYGYIMRNFQKFEFDVEHNMFYDVIPQAAGLEYYRAKYDYEYNFFEFWGGIAAGYRINDHISIGLGHYGGYVGIRKEIFSSVTVDAVDTTDAAYVASVTTRDEYKVDHMYVLFKPGIDIRFGKYKIAITAMLPSAKLWGQGSIEKSIDANGLDKYYDNPSGVYGLFPSFALAINQRQIKAKYKIAPSIAFGLEYENKRCRLAMALEYYFPIKEYEIMHADNAYIRPTTAGSMINLEDFASVKAGAYSVLNVGFGAEIKVARRWTVLTGAHTDFNNKVPLFKREAKNYVTETTPGSWHYMNFALGFSYRKANGLTFFGGTYNYGFSGNNNSFINFSEPTLGNNLTGVDRKDMRVNIHQFALVLGHTHFINGLALDKLGKKKRGTKSKKEKD